MINLASHLLVSNKFTHGHVDICCLVYLFGPFLKRLRLDAFEVKRVSLMDIFKNIIVPHMHEGNLLQGHNMGMV